MTRPTENRELYALGRRHFRRVARRLPSAWDEEAAVREVAADRGEGVAEVRTAYLFARAVDAVATVVPGARELILEGDNPHLTPSVVTDVSRKSANRVRAAMKRAASGLHPLAPPTPAGLAADLAPWDYDLTRLRQAAGLLDSVDAVVARPGRPLQGDEVAGLTLHATSVRVAAAALRPVVGPGRGRRTGGAAPRPGRATDRAGVVALAKKARGLVEGVAGDLPRAAHTRSLTAVRADLARAVRDVAAVAARIAEMLPGPTAVPPPAVEAAPGGPYDSPGTYLIVYRADEPRVVRLGRLGTFRLPAGYLLYVGSAFQAGGVATRTYRHLAGAGPRLWNTDYLWGFARPVERWWTHHPAEVECAWAMALAATRGCSCPAPGAGANDCKRCPAHLYHSWTRPSCADFARRLGTRGSGGYTVRRQVASGPAAPSQRGPLPPPLIGLW